MNRQAPGAALAEIGARYLAFMGRAFPVMTASENFYTFPRAHSALEHGDRVEILSERSVAQALVRVEGMLHELEGLDATALELEDRIDWHLLWGSMRTFVRDFGRRRVWQTDPVLVLKIVNLCCELNPTARLPQVPALLREAERTLEQVPRGGLEIALEMLAGESGIGARVGRVARQAGFEAGPILKALGSFEQRLRRDLLPRAEAGIGCGGEEFEDALRTLAGVDLTPEAVWERGWDQYTAAEEELRRTAARLGGGHDIPALEAELRDKHPPAGDLLELYGRSTAEARAFLQRSGLLSVPEEEGYTISVVGTEGAWMAAKSVAGYNCPRGQTRATLHVNRGDARQHTEHRLTVAHELYPGHHVQGLIARGSRRPVRQQFEVPIYYEGWATYAERLMVEQGFWPGDVAWFFCWKLRKFRAARILADTGLHTGRLTLDAACRVLEGAYVPAVVARREARRYTITPAYQVSYGLGLEEVERLRRRFEPALGLRPFHDAVLQGGDMPWRWVEARLEATQASRDRVTTQPEAQGGGQERGRRGAGPASTAIKQEEGREWS